MYKLKLFLLPALTSCLFFSAQAQLSSQEKKVVAYIDERMASSIDLLKESANINSGTLNSEGVKKVGAVYARELEKAGFMCTWVPMPDSIKRAGHLVAERKGKKGKKLFLIGHLDTVFEPDMPFTPFTLIDDSTATGQGVNDMKGGDVIIVKALQALHQFGLLEDVTITAYFTGDEEWAGSPITVTRGDFIERAKKSDIALGFEGATGLNVVATARRGASGWTLEVNSATGHSSGIFSPRVGFGAIYEAARIINEFRLALSSEQYLTFNPGLIVGGSEMQYDPNQSVGSAIGKDNIISPRVVVTGDLRFLSEVQKENARAKMREIVSNNLTGTTAKISFEDGIPSMEPTAGNAKILDVIDGISSSLGQGKTVAGNPGARGAGDISYIAAHVDCVDGLGATGSGAHAPGEKIKLNDLPYLIKRAALLIYRLTNSAD